LSEKRYSVLNKDNDSSVSLLQTLVRRTRVLEVLHAALFAALLVVAYAIK